MVAMVTFYYLQTFFKRKLEVSKNAIMNAFIKHEVFKLWGRKFKSKGEREDHERMQKLLEKGEVEKRHEFMTDLLHEKFDQVMFGLLPVVKIDKDKYMIGTEKKQVLVKNEALIVRIGGGFESFDKHIEHVSRPECLKITHTMRAKNIDYTETVIHYLD